MCERTHACINYHPDVRACVRLHVHAHTSRQDGGARRVEWRRRWRGEREHKASRTCEPLAKTATIARRGLVCACVLPARSKRPLLIVPAHPTSRQPGAWQPRPPASFDSCPLQQPPPGACKGRIETRRAPTTPQPPHRHDHSVRALSRPERLSLRGIVRLVSMISVWAADTPRSCR